MLQISYIRQYPEEVVKRLSVKNFKAADTVGKILEIDQNRRAMQKKLDDVLSDSNNISREIGGLFKQGRQQEAEVLRQRTTDLKLHSKDLSEQLEKLETEQNNLLLELPNLPHPSVPAGRGAEENEIALEWGDIPSLPENAMPHWELAAKYDIINFDLGNKLTGAGFPVYKGKGAALQRALINFFLNKANEAGYTEYQPPLLVNEASAYGTGQLPDKEGQMYYVGIDNLYLIPTAEVPITNIFRDVILREDELPVKSVAYSSCFRREAGSYGKDVRGLNRLHQFDKVEIVQVQHPERSYDTLQEMVDHVANLLRKLELPFRILKLCGGDMSFTSALTYDMEVYSAGQQKWLEVSSISNFESFQANRMKLRYRDGDGKTQLAHTLNGSALALPRIVAALLENNQVDGGIRIPAALVPFTGFEMIS